MDHHRFDSLARRVFADTRRSRRGALAVVPGAALLPASPDGVLDKRKRKKTAPKPSAQPASRCYPGKHCAPGAGKNTSRGDFAFSTEFRNTIVRGANLSRSSFRGADLWTQQCNAPFSECNGRCVATDTGTFPCWIGCVG